MKARPLLALVAVAAFAFGVAGAGLSATSLGAGGLTPIKYSTSFGTFGRDAYAYVAVEKGYFRDAGFDVTIVPGAGSVAVATQVAAGTVDFGPADTSALVLARGESNLPVKIVAMIHQNTMSGYLALRSSGIASPKDLEGKRIADTPGSTATVLFPLYAKRAGIDASKVTFVPASAPALPSLLASKQVDAVGQFAVGIPTFQAAAGAPISSLTYAKVVPGLMGLGLLASDEAIRTKPDVVRRFTAALLRGERYAIQNPGDAGRILNRYVPVQNPVVAAQELKIMKKYVVTEAVKKNGYGYVDRRRFASTVSIVNNFFKPKTRMTVADVYAQGFLPQKPIKG